MKKELSSSSPLKLKFKLSTGQAMLTAHLDPTEVQKELKNTCQNLLK